jgi:hypothetical protein
MSATGPFTAIAPEETAAAPALPLTLLVRPWPVLALVVLAVNDHVLKGSGAVPGWATGKLSDFAGMLFFPLLLVTLWNLACDGVNGVLRRPSLSSSATTTQLMIACLATGAFFSAVQIHESVATFYADVTAALAFWSDAPTAVVTMDPTDVVAVPMVVVAFWLGQRAIARVPPGRLPWLRAQLASVRTEDERRALAAAGLRDVRVAAPKARRALVDGLVDALAEQAPDDELDALLARLRGEVPFASP